MLYFTEFFKEEFDVLTLAVTGENPENWKISFLSWTKGQQLIDLESIQEEEEIYSAEELNEIIYQELGFTRSKNLSSLVLF